MPLVLVGQGWRGTDTQTSASSPGPVPSSPLAVSAPFQDTQPAGHDREWWGDAKSAFGNRRDFLLPLSESDFH